MLALLVLAGCGSSSSSSSTGSEHEQLPAGAQSVQGRVLRAGELKGFAPLGRAVVGLTPASWISGLELPPTERVKEEARLRRVGFTKGVRERLAPNGGGTAEAISVVEQFASAHDASAELNKQLEGLRVRGATTFAVKGIPGARVVAIGTTQRSGANVEFAKGPYFYVVGAGWPTGSHAAPTKADVEEAAQHLYGRVSG